MLGALIGGGLSALGGLLGGNSVKKAAKRNDALLTDLQKTGTGYIDAGYDEAKGHLGGVNDIWRGLSEQSGGLSGLSLLGDALGVNGADGTGRAQTAFQTGPGYQFQLDQGLDALERRASAQGRLSSGQTGLDTINYAQGLANQEWGNWLNNLSGFGGQQAGLYTTGLTGQAGSLSDLASLATGTADRRLNLASEVVNGKMGANNQTAAGTQMQLGGLGGLGKAFGAYLGNTGWGQGYS